MALRRWWVAGLGLAMAWIGQAQAGPTFDAVRPAAA
jgi:hypothetical protein